MRAYIFNQGKAAGPVLKQNFPKKLKAICYNYHQEKMEEQISSVFEEKGGQHGNDQSGKMYWLWTLCC